MKAEPLRLLSRNLNEEVVVKLKDGRACRGVLESCDNYMNLILRDAEEVDDSEAGNPGAKVRYGRVLIRGSNILWVTLSRQ
ncbi:MAG: LSM domain-containing protein [Candidatus Nezhaarchaeales archaeon]